MTSISIDNIRGARSSLAIKAAVRTATTASITLNGLQIVDGILLVQNDRVLVKDQADATQNGVYNADTGGWQRAPDFDGNDDVAMGALIAVNLGTVNGSSYWQVISTDPITIDTDDIDFGRALINDSSSIRFSRARANAKVRDVLSKLRESLSYLDSEGATPEDQLQNAINDCIANQLDLEIPDICVLTSSRIIDRLVDAAASDDFFTIFSKTGGGFRVSTAINMFTSSLVNGVNPVSQLVRFVNIKFQSTDATVAAYVLNGNKFLRTQFVGCGFTKIKLLEAQAMYYLQSISLIECQSRRHLGWFMDSPTTTFDCHVEGGLYEAGGDGFDWRFPVGCSFETQIEGMTNTAFKFTGARGLFIRMYGEANGDGVVGGASIDGSAGTGSAANVSVFLAGSNFAGDPSDPTKASVLWGECLAGASIGNHSTTTLHHFITNSRVESIADYGDVACTTGIEPRRWLRASAQQNYGGTIYPEYIGGRGGLLHLRSLQSNVESANGIDIDENGNVIVGGQLNVSGDFMLGGNARLNLAASVTPAVNLQMTVQLTSNTSLTFKVKGSDGTVRSGSITLS